MGVSKKQLLSAVRQIKDYTDKKMTTGAVVPVSYSTEEQVIGEWIDGKPLYEKVVDLGIDTTITANKDIITAIST